MHILLINDDGPPSPASPYITRFIKALRSHPSSPTISVCLPETQRSWIGKAHFIGKNLTTTLYCPDPSSSEAQYFLPNEKWVLVDGTPASCAQLGIHHLFKSRGPIDLVISGPNFGRNSSAVFALSSGTLGGALEAAAGKCKSIALSYAFDTKTHDWDIVDKACRISADLCMHLYKTWPEDDKVDVFSVNVPLKPTVHQAKIVYSYIYQNTWGTCYREIEEGEKVVEGEDTLLKELETRTSGGGAEEDVKKEPVEEKVSKSYAWAPNFIDVTKVIQDSPMDSDGQVLFAGNISVTPLKANFWHSSGFSGEIKL